VNVLFHLLENSPSLLGLMAMGICWAITRRIRWFCITAVICCMLFLFNDMLIERWVPQVKDFGPKGAGVGIPPSYAIAIWAGLMLLRHVVELYRCWKEKPQRFFAMVVSFVAFLLILGAMWQVGIPVR
jgi:hypothetical protein